MRREQVNHSVDALFALVTFLFYAGAMLAFLYLGVSVYRSVTDRMEQHYEMGTARAYLTEKLRQNDTAGAISIDEIDDCQALVLTQEIGETAYQTYIYACDGMLKELLIPEGRGARAADGTELLALEEMTLEETADGVIRFSLAGEDGETAAFTIQRRAADE